ncbi:MAG: PilZ domain-containing protein [Deltaproteobacteria bacterium]|nr:PilZ domain-containing protein [Deltaproteobacteria bacterium]
MERRKHERIGDHVAVIDPEGTSGLATPELQDISSGGARFWVSEVVRPGTSVQVAIRFPGSGRRIAVAGRVVWARMIAPHEIGVRFLNVDETTAATLAEHLPPGP